MMRHRITPVLSVASTLALASATFGAEPASVRAVVGQYCVGCHAAAEAKGGLDLASVVSDDIGRHSPVWEKVVRRLRGRQMPPAGRKRPDEDTYASVVSQL